MSGQDFDGPLGVVTAPDTVRIERLLPGPMERLWAYLTDTEKRRQWLAGGEMELFVGGRVELLFRHHELSPEPTPERYKHFETIPAMFGEVTECDPPRLLAYRWPGDNGRAR